MGHGARSQFVQQTPRCSPREAMTARSGAKMHKIIARIPLRLPVGVTAARVGATVAKARWTNTGIQAHEILEAADYDLQTAPSARSPDNREPGERIHTITARSFSTPFSSHRGGPQGHSCSERFPLAPASDPYRQHRQRGFGSGPATAIPSR